MQPVPKPTAADFDELLAFQATLCAPGFEPVLKWSGGRQSDGNMQLPYPEYHPAVDKFIRSASKECWRDYDYAAHIDSLRSDLGQIARADLPQLRTVLTYIVRGERFSDGHWGAMLTNGTVCAVLVRVAELRAELGN